MAKTKVKLGDSYNRLTVTGWGERRDGRPGRTALCECECGTEGVAVLPHRLVSGNTVSCGCKRVDNARVARTRRAGLLDYEPGQAAANHLFRSYVYGARSRGLSWSLSKESFLSVATGDCYYCGAPPSREYVTTNGCYGSYLCNGVDRMDSGLGYEPQNVVPCCSPCNLAKRDSSADDFIRMCAAVTKFHGLIGT